MPILQETSTHAFYRRQSNLSIFIKVLDVFILLANT